MTFSMATIVQFFPMAKVVLAKRIQCMGRYKTWINKGLYLERAIKFSNKC